MRIYKIAQDQSQDKTIKWLCPITGIYILGYFHGKQVIEYGLYSSDGSFYDAFDNFWHAKNWAIKNIDRNCQIPTMGIKTSTAEHKVVLSKRKHKRYNKLDTQLFPECEGTDKDRDIVKKNRKKKKANNGFKIYKLSSNLNGEWWIIDGQAIFADGDVGDTTHEGYAIEHAQNLLFDGQDFNDMAEWKFSKAYELYNKIKGGFNPDIQSEQKEKARNDPEAFILEHIDKSDIDEGVFFVANGNSSDVRLFAMKKWGWKRMAGTEITTWTLTPDDLYDIYAGIDDAYENEIEEEKNEGKESKFNIEVLSTKTTYWNVPLSIIGSRNVMNLRDYNRSSMFGPVTAKTKGARVKIYKIAQDAWEMPKLTRLVGNLFNKLSAFMGVKVDRDDRSLLNCSIEKMDEALGTCWLQVYHDRINLSRSDSGSWNTFVTISKYYENERLDQEFGKSKKIHINLEDTDGSFNQIQQTILSMK